jgi:lysozyme family protein
LNLTARFGGPFLSSTAFAASGRLFLLEIKMIPNYDAIAPGYENLLSGVKIMPNRRDEVSRACVRLLQNRSVYAEVGQRARVPTALLMALNYREDSGRLDCYLGNGQPLNHRTTIVPIGRGPFPNWVAGALDALHLDGLDKVADLPGGWTWARLCFEAELWNGFGYRARGIPSPYVFGATNAQRPGKFPRDHVFDPTMMDPQLGVVAIILGLIELDPSLSLADPISSIVAAPSHNPSLPEGFGGSIDGVKILQSDLNALGFGQIDVDGSYGRQTRAAVRGFQIKFSRKRNDGIADSATLNAIQSAVQGNAA